MVRAGEAAGGVAPPCALAGLVTKARAADVPTAVADAIMKSRRATPSMSRSFRTSSDMFEFLRGGRPGVTLADAVGQALAGTSGGVASEFLLGTRHVDISSSRAGWELWCRSGPDG